MREGGMKARCEPGDRCVIVAEIAGCDCNIGATVTVTIGLPGMDYLGKPVFGWLFEDASRPLKAVDVDNAGNVVPGTETWVTDSGHGLYTPWLSDHHLLPVHGAGELPLEDKREEVPA
jgi:hypothetical protein